MIDTSKLQDGINGLVQTMNIEKEKNALEILK
jgi:hypothetical protein